MTPELKEQLRAVKPSIVSELRKRQEPTAATTDKQPEVENSVAGKEAVSDRTETITPEPPEENAAINDRDAFLEPEELTGDFNPVEAANANPANFAKTADDDGKADAAVSEPDPSCYQDAGLEPLPPLRSMSGRRLSPLSKKACSGRKISLTGCTSIRKSSSLRPAAFWIVRWPARRSGQAGRRMSCLPCIPNTRVPGLTPGEFWRIRSGVRRGRS